MPVLLPTRRQLQPVGGANAPEYHFAGGTFDAGGPSGFTFQNESAFFGFLTAAAPLEPLKLEADADAALCESSPIVSVPNVTFDDDLARSRCPSSTWAPVTASVTSAPTPRRC